MMAGTLPVCLSFYLIDMLVSILFQSEYTHCDMKEQRQFSLLMT